MGAARLLERPDPHEIMKVHDSNHLAALDDEERLNLVADLLKRLRHQRVRRDGARALRHDVADGGVEGEIRLQAPAQIAVGYDPGEPAAVIEHGDAAETLRRDLDDRLGHASAS